MIGEDPAQLEISKKTLARRNTQTDLGPRASVHLVVEIAKLARKRHNQRDDELGNRARVGERRVEHRNAAGATQQHTAKQTKSTQKNQQTS